MPTIKLSDTEVLQVIHHINNLDMAKHLAGKLQQAINNDKEEPKHKGYQLIWESLGMSLSGPPTIDKILTTIEHTKRCETERDKRMAERFNILEALRTQLSVQNWDQISGALANLKQRVVDAERDLKEREKDIKYLRASLKDIENALVLPPGYTAAYLVEKVGIVAKSHDVLRQFMQASGFTDNDGVPTMLSVLAYRKAVTAAADTLAEDTNLDTAVYLVKMNDELKHKQREAVAECNRANEYAADIGNLTSKLEQIRNIMNEHPRSSNSDWARIQEILG